MSYNELRLDPEKPRIKILCFDITNCSNWIQFTLCTIAVFIFFLLYGYIQELIFTIEGFQRFGWFLTLVQFMLYTSFGFVETRLRHDTVRRIPIITYMLLAVLTLGTMGFSNSSLGYLNYPTQVIFKCCKLIPVLVGSILIQGKRYGPLDFSAAVLMCVGLTLFTLADSHVQPNFNTKGITLISMALLCDAVIGNLQEKSMKMHNATNAEVVLYSYFIGFIYLLTIMLLNGEFWEGLYFFATNPRKIYGYTIMFSISGYLGTQIVLTLVRTCGAFAAVTVTTFRKAITIVLSFLFFSKPFTYQYLWSGLLVILGIYLNMYSKRHPMSTSDFESLIEKFIYFVKVKFSSNKYVKNYITNV